MGTYPSLFAAGSYIAFPHGEEELVVQWNDFESKQHINFLELGMVWWLVHFWSQHLCMLNILVKVDNTVTRSVINRGSSKSPQPAAGAGEATAPSHAIPW
jgi:hypothetical protein